ncbi:non-hydrolyzing UDP-N-acetylglucosamine 2-epimerase [Haloarcula laminariae]|uniref:non-hydrolyzing UDP-N-acetylglucosamine 2-epimerase n=1 Tax=Haloarcula laminariae TaxID=2961577 RepID=UPI0021C97FE1|nr:UDP-N-acetylglucosamine 2-epimerase (non-hydrolyzing) [Halomicroarcula laminariae]
MNTATHVTIVLGTRPEIIKLSPVIRACEREGVPFTLVHTGQHYSESLDSVFFDQLELPEPDYQLDVGSGSHGEQTGAMLAEIERVILDVEPDLVLVQGDTNSVLAGALAASKLPVEIGHVEAGLRSFDREMPEETNRVLADHVADYLFAPTETSADYLRDEGLDNERIHVTGNTVVDAVQRHSDFAAEKSAVLKGFELEPDEFILLTAHRAENVDDRDRFADLLDGVARAASALDREVVYPIHPRGRQRLDEFDLMVPDCVRLVDPQDYLDFLELERAASVILTDSGGVQEEACILGVPCVTLRDNTERPETIDVGANRLVGVDSDAIRDGAVEMYERTTGWENPFGDGTASEQILTAVCERSTDDQQVSQ